MKKRCSGCRGLAVVAAAIAVVAGAAGLPSAAQESGSPVVSEHGLGTGVDDERNLVGRAETFTEGEQVWFWTRVVGADAGQRIQHVWIREGEEVLTVGLTVGGPHWRTWSNKWMHPGSAGAWRVEVRDAEGNVLAGASFTCTPVAGEADAPQDAG